MAPNFGFRIGDFPEKTAASVDDEVEVSLAGSGGSRRMSLQNLLTTLLGYYAIQPGENGTTVLSRFYPFGHARRYGATFDGGTTDDATALQNAIAAVAKTAQWGTVAGQGMRVELPSGISKIGTPVGLTGFQFHLRGHGKYQTVLRGNTGGVGSGVLIDQTGTGVSKIEDLSLEQQSGVGSNPSVLGILQARTTAPGNQAYDLSLRDLAIIFGTSATALGGVGTVGIYNVNCEGTTYDGLLVRADVALYIASGNPLGVVSPVYGAIAHDISMTVVGVRGTSWLRGIAGPSVRINGGGEIDLGDTQLSSSWNDSDVQAVRPTLTAPYPAAIDVTADVTALKYTGSMEGFPSLIQSSHVLKGVNLDCMAAHGGASPLIKLTGASAAMLGGKVNIIPASGSSSGTLIGSDTATQIQDVEIHLYNANIALAAGSSIKGCRIISQMTLAATKAAITGVTAANFTGNTIIASDASEVQPPATTAATLINSWVNFNAASYPVAGYYLHNGRVWLEGFISTGSANTVAFVLPVGYRPAKDTYVTIMANGVANYAIVGANGNVTIGPIASSANLSLAGISFTQAG